MQASTETLTLPNLSNTSNRILSVDILRGIVMVVMALDHTRDFFSNYKADPLDFEHAGLAMYFTRWITHYCAPVFVFLSGASAFLSLHRGKTKKEASWLLFTRGVWLLVLELTVVRLGWSFNFDYHAVFVQVIWAIGWSMIFLSLLVYLPLPAIAAIGFIIVFGHNALDGISDKSFYYPGVWDVMHHQGRFVMGNHLSVFVIYPLVPWIGVMALGYCFGTILMKPISERHKWLYGIGLAVIILFILLRWSNLYGDPNLWHMHFTTRQNLLDFIRCQKYPPSLLYLLMTIGPAIIIMPLLEKLNNPIGRFFMVYGRVPMFYYVLHIYLIHGLALITGLCLGFPSALFTDNQFLFSSTLKWGFSLPVVYLYWIAAVLILYLPSRWFMGVKMRHKKWWLSYL